MYDLYFKVTDGLVGNHILCCKSVFNISVKAKVDARTSEFHPFPSLSSKSMSHFFNVVAISHHKYEDITTSHTFKRKRS